MGESPKVLVADDDPGIVDLIKTLLEAEGFSVLSACNGLEALREVEHHRPDIVLLDIMMPMMDGITCCKELRSNPNTSDTLVVVMSATVDIAELKGIGATDFIAKPFDNDHLVRLLNTWLQARRGLSPSAN